MRAALDKWIYETGDQGQLPEDPEIELYWGRFFKKHYATKMGERGLAPDASHEAYLAWWEKALTSLENGGPI